MRRVACLAVLATACSTTPVAPEPLPAKVEPTPSPPAPTLVIDVLQGFTGDAHDVIALPDGECIAALSWFGDTDYGAGPRRTDDRGRQGVLVRYRVDGSVRWASDVKVWPADLVFDGKDRVLVVGDPRDGTTNWIVLDAATGAITQSGLLEGYAKAAAFARTGHPLVLATALSPSQAFVHDALATPTRGAWSVDATLAYTLAATADGGVIATVSGVGSSDEIVAIAVAQDGRERWRRALCRTDYSAPIVVDEAGNATIVACAPARIFQLAKDGTVTRDRPLALPGKGHVRVDAVATQGDRMVFAGQLHGELDFAGRTFAAWDVVEGGRKSGAGDVVVLVLAGDEIVAIAHGHGREADEVTGIAATHDGAVWVVGNARHELDFGDGKAIAADAHERGRGFVARIELAR